MNFEKEPPAKKPEGDPTRQSVWPKSIQGLKRVGTNNMERPILADRYDRRFHKITHSPPDQIFLVRLLKGIVPVLDVAYFGSEHGRREGFYSYELPSQDDIKYSAKDVAEDAAAAWADRMLLWRVFGDWDHGTNHNAQTAPGRHVLYDFGRFRYFWNPPPNHPFTREYARQNVAAASLPQLRALRERLREVRERCEGEAGAAFMEAILDSMKKEGIDRPEVLKVERNQKQVTVQDFQDEIIRRIDALNAIVEDRISQLERE